MANSTPRDITYPLDSAPDNGAWQAIDDDLIWLRMPLPITLEHINLWLVRDGDGWATVDTGMRTRETMATWAHVNDAVLDGQGLTRVMVTHMHPDHVGMAGWLCREFDIRLWMTRLEYFLCRMLVADTGREAPTDGVAFYRAAGLGEDQVERYKRLFGQFGKAVYHMPDAYVRLEEGQVHEMAGHRFEIVCGNGHSPEHACLFDAERNLLISGDQILPTISSNVSVWPTEPDADPLGDWLDSCRRLRERLPEDVLVLPAHGRPFRGARERLTALIKEHEEGLSAVLEACATPKRAVDLFGALFRSAITDNNRTMATGEAVAHVNYLLARNELQVAEVRDGVRYYART